MTIRAGSRALMAVAGAVLVLATLVPAPRATAAAPYFQAIDVRCHTDGTVNKIYLTDYFARSYVGEIGYTYVRVYRWNGRTWDHRDWGWTQRELNHARLPGPTRTLYLSGFPRTTGWFAVKVWHRYYFNGSWHTKAIVDSRYEESAGSWPASVTLGYREGYCYIGSR